MKTNSNENKVLLHLYRVNVTNTGSVPGDDVVLAYVIPPSKSLNDPSPPLKALFGFERVHLDVNQTIQVFFSLNIQSLLTVAHDGSKWLEPGSYRILVGQQHMHTVHLQEKAAQWSKI
jgi:beta-glucosidase